MNTKRSSVLLLILGLCWSGITFASRHVTVDPRVRDVRVIFIKGNNEAAVKARENLSKWTCFHLAENPSLADATLEFSQQQSVSGAIFSGNRERSIVTAELTSKDGNVIWSASSSRDAGLINTGAGSAAHYVLNRLEAESFPDIKVGIRSVDHSNCPEVGVALSTVAPPKPPDPKSASVDTSKPERLGNSTPISETKEVKLGMTTDQVESVLGAPLTKVDLGEKSLYKYKDMTIEFHAGKVTDVR